MTHVDKAGKKVERSVGTWCWCCGVAAEAWPLWDKEDIVHKYHAGGDFKREFTLVRAGVREADRHIEDSTVSKDTVVGLRVIIKCNFVTTTNFTIYFHLPPGSVSGVSVVTVPSPVGGDLEGVLFSREAFPQDLPHYEIEIYSESSSRLSEMLLSSEDVLRAGQAVDTWTYSNTQSVSSRPAGLKVSGISKLTTVPRAQATAEQVQRDREQRENEQGAQDDANEADAAVTCMAVSGSRLSKLAPQAPPPKKPPGRQRASSKGATTTGFSGGGGAAARAGVASARGGSNASGNFGGAQSVAGSVRSHTRTAASPGGDGATVLSLNAATTPQSARQHGIDLVAILTGWAAGREILGVSL